MGYGNNSAFGYPFAGGSRESSKSKRGRNETQEAAKKADLEAWDPNDSS
jgi:hypothetical protein